MLANNLNFGLLEIVEGTFQKFTIFRQNFEFSNFRADFPCLGQNRYILNLYFRYLTVFWVSELVFLASELIFLVSEHIPLYFGCLNLYFGCLNLYFGCLNLYRLCWVSELILLGIRGPSILV